MNYWLVKSEPSEYGWEDLFSKGEDIWDGIRNYQARNFLKEMKTKANYKFTPVIMLTTEGAEEKKREGQAAGAKAWIVKPFRPEQMLQAVSMLI